MPNSKKLYKYREINEFTFKIFEDSSLFFASPNLFNDPYDSFYTEKNGLQDMAKRLGQPFNDGHKKEQIQKFKKNVAILSLSHNSDNILLWSHYADDHKGICLEFEIDDYDNFFNDKTIDNRPLQYTKTPAILDIHRHQEALIPAKNGGFLEGPRYSTNSIDAQCFDALFIKNKIWTYEEEYRFVKRGKPFSAHFQPSNLKSVIIGSECESTFLIKALLDAFNTKYKTNATLKKATTNNDDYKMDIDDL